VPNFSLTNGLWRFSPQVYTDILLPIWDENRPKDHQFDQIFKFGHTVPTPSFPDQSQMWHEMSLKAYCAMPKFSLIMLYCHRCVVKTMILSKFCIFGSPFPAVSAFPIRAILSMMSWTRGLCLHAKLHLNQFILLWPPTGTGGQLQAYLITTTAKPFHSSNGLTVRILMIPANFLPLTVFHNSTVFGLFLRVWCVSATSAPIERIFSQSGIITWVNWASVRWTVVNADVS